MDNNLNPRQANQITSSIDNDLESRENLTPEEKYFFYYDDTSSEEEESSKLEELYAESNAVGLDRNFYKVTDVEFELSFLAHEFGIRLLKSKKVAEHYYPLKRKYLKNDPELLPKDGDIRDVLKSCIKDAVKNDELEQLKLFTNKLLEEKRILEDKRSFVKFAKQFNTEALAYGYEIEPVLLIELANEFNNAINSKVKREVLPNFFEISWHENYSPATFLAYIRLMRCSNVRIARNYEDNEDYLFKREKLNSVGVRFPGLPQLGSDEQKITINGLRKDRINTFELGSSYKEINSALDILKEKLEATDAEIAEWLKCALQGEGGGILEYTEITALQKEQLSKFINSLTYLLFGTEAARNPASLVIHNMMLELIQEGKLTWKKAFKEGLMPMSFGGAVKAARRTHEHYKTTLKYSYDKPNHLPYHQTYSGYKKNTYLAPELSETLTQLAKKEADIFKRWLELKGIKINGNESIDDSLKNRIISELIEGCKEWFGIDPTSNGYLALMNLREVGVSFNEIKKIYRESQKKFLALGSDGALGLLKREKEITFKTLCTLWDRCKKKDQGLEFTGLVNAQEGSLENASLYFKLGSIFRREEDYDLALKYDKESLGIKKSKTPKNYSSIAASYKNIGITYFRQEKYKLALERFYKCLDLRIKPSSKDGPEVVQCYKKIASCYGGLGLDEEKSEYERKKDNPNEQLITEIKFSPKVLGVELNIKDTLGEIHELVQSEGATNDRYEQLEQKLGKLKDLENFKEAMLLAFKYTNMAIMRIRKQKTKVIKEIMKKFAEEHSDIITQAAENYPDYFIDESIITALQDFNKDDDRYQGALRRILGNKNLAEEDSESSEDALESLEDGLKSLYCTGAQYDNELLNSAEGMGFLTYVIKKYGSEAGNKLMELGKDTDAIGEVLNAVKEQGAEAVANLLLGSDAAKDNNPKSQEAEKELDNQGSCKAEASEDYNRHFDDEDDRDNGSAGEGSPDSTIGTTVSSTEQTSTTTSTNNKNQNNSDKGAGNSEAPSNEVALLLVVAEIVKQDSWEQVGRLGFQLEHLKEAGEVLPTLAPYVEAIRDANPGLFVYANEETDAQEHGSSGDITQEQKVISSLGVIVPSEKLIAQVRHYLTTGEMYETLRAVHTQAHLGQESQRETEEQVYEFEQQGNATNPHSQEINVDQSLASGELFSIGVFS